MYTIFWMDIGDTMKKLFIFILLLSNVSLAFAAQDKYGKLQKACDNNKFDKCVELGLLYENGHGENLDRERAFNLYKKACSSGYSEGCVHLGVMYTYSTGVTELDYAKAAELYEKACGGGSARGCMYLADLFEEHAQGVDKLLSRIEGLRQKACELGEWSGCFSLGMSYAGGDGLIKKDDAKSKKYFEKYELLLKKETLQLRESCKTGNGSDCYTLAHNYQYSHVYKENEEENEDEQVISLLKMSCAASYAQGCHDLGQEYYKGYKVEQDYKKAIELYIKACDGGLGDGCHKLVLMYEQGIGVKADSKKSSEYNKKACDLKYFGCNPYLNGD
mgnify:CR=1 FL=1